MMRKRQSTRKALSVELLEDRLCLSSYSILDLAPPLGLGWWLSEGNAVNDAGWVAGDGADSSSYVSAAVWRLDTGKMVPTALPEIVSRASRANDINKSLQVVGFSDTTLNGPDPQTPNTPHAVLWQLDAQGIVTSLTDLGGVPNYPYTEANGINNLGQVVGGGTNSNFQHTAFLWDSTNGMRDLNTLLPAGSGWQLTGASDINDNSQIVGTGLHSGVSRGFRFDLGTSTIIDLGTLAGGAASGANAVNGLGQAVGAAETGKINSCNRMNSDAFLYKNGSLTDLGSLGDAGSTALGINDSGVVVGTYFKTNHDPFNNCMFYDTRAFVWQNGAMTDLRKLLPKNAKWTLFSASDISSTGRIVGAGLVGTGTTPQNHGFLLVPSSPLMAATTATAPVTRTLSKAQVAPLLREAIARWQAAGVDVSSLRSIHVQITNLPGNELGEAAGRTIWLDDNAAGWGWYVDRTPWEDSEFATPGNQGEQNRMDLLTVLAHEIGHLLGYDHSDSGASAAGDVMQETLSAGERLLRHGVAVNDTWWLAGLPVLKKKRDPIPE